MKNIKNFLKKKKIKREKKLEKDIKILLKKKKYSQYCQERKNYMTKKEIFIQHIKNNYLMFLNILGQLGLFQE